MAVHSMDRRVLVKGVDMNRAVDRDVVAVKMLDEASWAAPSIFYCLGH